MDIIREFRYNGNLPDENVIINANRNNRYTGNNLKKKYTRYVAWEAKAQNLKPLTEKVNLHCIWYRKNKRKDKDNISAGLKFVLDGLQDAGVLKNDGWKEIGTIHHYYEVNKDEKLIVLFEKTTDEGNFYERLTKETP